MNQEVLKLALEWAEAHGEIVFAGGDMDAVNKMNSWVTAIKEALREHAMREMQRLGQEIEQEPVKWSDYEPDGVHHNKPEQKPVAWMFEGWGPDCGPYFEIYRDDEMGWRNKKEWIPLYTTPPQRKPLTDEEIMHRIDTHIGVPSQKYPLDISDLISFARAIEHESKGKNT
jgi:hypothetical protein